MKIYVYDCLSENGRPRFVSVEISDLDAIKWEIEDFERRVREARKGEVVQWKTAQEIQDEIDKVYINNDRKEYRHRYKNNAKKLKEDEDVDIFDTVSDDDYRPGKKYEDKLNKVIMEKSIEEAMNKVSEKQRRRIIMRYVENKTLREIAEDEGCDITSIRESITSGISKIRKLQR